MLVEGSGHSSWRISYRQWGKTLVYPSRGMIQRGRAGFFKDNYSIQWQMGQRCIGLWLLLGSAFVDVDSWHLHGVITR
jgi:hypothetical protein